MAKKRYFVQKDFLQFKRLRTTINDTLHAKISSSWSMNIKVVAVLV